MKEGIDRKTLAFTCPLEDDDQGRTIYIPVSPAARMESIAPILSHIYSVSYRAKLTVDAVVADYDYYAKEACAIYGKRLAGDFDEVKPLADELYKKFENFIEAAFFSASVILADGKTSSGREAKLSKESLNLAMGKYIFFCCASRYASNEIKKNAAAVYGTCLELTAYASSLPTLSSTEGSAGAKAPD